MKIHEKYINRCIEIAKNGLGLTAPNPMVGCVIVHENTIIGEGFTSPYGGPHAEVNAINSVKDKTLLKTSSLYVTLEPCSHFGITPPCCNLIIEKQIPNVIIGTIDINRKVAGEGIKKLQTAGCTVTVGVLENECKIHHKRFFTFHNKRRPYIILKWAETKDGFIAPNEKQEKKPIWISNEYSRQLVHKWRAEEQAILVGTKTVLEDNPSLTTRNWKGKNPIRVVLDKHKKIDKNHNIYSDEADTLRITDSEINFDDNLAANICDYLYVKNIQSIIIEGGSHTLNTFIQKDLWDEARVFIGDTIFKEGIKAPDLNENLFSKKNIQNDTLKIYHNKRNITNIISN